MHDGMTEVKCSISIRCSAETLYAHWRDFESLPEIMSNVKVVDDYGRGFSHWEVVGPAGLPVAWDAEITADEPGQRIAWQTIGAPDVESEGEVTFSPAEDGEGTLLEVQLRYRSPGGAAGRAFARLFHKDAATELTEDLQRFKAAMEGEACVNESPEASPV